MQYVLHRLIKSDKTNDMHPNVNGIVAQFTLTNVHRQEYQNAFSNKDNGNSVLCDNYFVRQHE